MLLHLCPVSHRCRHIIAIHYGRSNLTWIVSRLSKRVCFSPATREQDGPQHTSVAAIQVRLWNLARESGARMQVPLIIHLLLPCLFDLWGPSEFNPRSIIILIWHASWSRHHLILLFSLFDHFMVMTFNCTCLLNLTSWVVQLGQARIGSSTYFIVWIRVRVVAGLVTSYQKIPLF